MSASIATLILVPTPSALETSTGFLQSPRHAEQPAESAELADGARGERGFDEPPDALLGVGRRFDVDAGARVVEARRPSRWQLLLERHQAAHLAHALVDLGARDRSSSRSIENFSTANDPITEP